MTDIYEQIRREEEARKAQERLNKREKAEHEMGGKFMCFWVGISKKSAVYNKQTQGLFRGFNSREERDAFYVELQLAERDGKFIQQQYVARPTTYDPPLTFI